MHACTDATQFMHTCMKSCVCIDLQMDIFDTVNQADCFSLKRTRI